MKANLKAALKDAMKAQDKVKMETIRSILSDMQYEEMQKGVDELPANDVITIIQRSVKKRQEEKDFALQANRNDLIEKLNAEISICDSFLPQQLTAGELEKIVSDIKAADSTASLNTVMKHLKDSYLGRYDGKMASEVAKRLLG